MKARWRIGTGEPTKEPSTAIGRIRKSRTGTSSHPQMPGASRPTIVIVLPSRRIIASSVMFSTRSAPEWTRWWAS